MDPMGPAPGERVLLDEVAGFVVLRAGSHRVAVVFCEAPDDRICDQVRRLARAFPIVVVCGRASPAGVEALLAAGAADCIPLGAGIAGLAARFDRSLGGPNGAPAGAAVRLTDCGLAVGAWEIRLTPIEYRIAQVLWAADGRTVAHAELERAVYGRSGLAERQAVRQAIYRLRARLGPLGRVVPPELGLLSTCYAPVMVS